MGSAYYAVFVWNSSPAEIEVGVVRLLQKTGGKNNLPLLSILSFPPKMCANYRALSCHYHVTFDLEVYQNDSSFPWETSERSHFLITHCAQWWAGEQRHSLVTSRSASFSASVWFHKVSIDEMSLLTYSLCSFLPFPGVGAFGRQPREVTHFIG